MNLTLILVALIIFTPVAITLAISKNKTYKNYKRLQKGKETYLAHKTFSCNIQLFHPRCGDKEIRDYTHYWIVIEKDSQGKATGYRREHRPPAKIDACDK